MIDNKLEGNFPGHLVLLMAPSGSGKSVLLRRLREQFRDGIQFAVSCTTRPRRPGEIDGDLYYFLSPQSFAEKIQRDEFLEWAEYGGHLYGTLKSEVLEPMRAGAVVIREVDAQGVKAILDLLPPQAVTVIYIDAGDWKMLKGRITARAPISEEELQLRHQRFVAETASKHLANRVVTNEDGQLEATLASLVAILNEILDNATQHA